MGLSELRQAIDIIRQALETGRSCAAMVQCCATLVALAVGALWSYWLFVQKRQKYPRASIEHQITHRHIAHDKVLLHVEVVVSNTGNVLIELVESATVVSQVLPLPTEVREKVVAMQDPVEEPKTDIDWPILDSRENRWAKDDCEIEPGESQGIQRDFILHGDIRTVEVYSYLMNEWKRKKELSWDLTTLYDITDSRSE